MTYRLKQPFLSKMPVAKAECTKPSFQLLAIKQNQMHVSYLSVSHLHAGETSKAKVLRVERAVTELNYGPSLMSSVVEKDRNRPIRLTQCYTQFKSPGDKILCVLYLHYNVAFTFK